MMLGKDSPKRRIVIVGAGFSGLVAAWSLNRDGFDVTVVEEASRSGGLIASMKASHGLVESGPNGLLCSELVEALFLDCGLSIQETKKSSRKRFLCVDSEVTRYPLSFSETLKVLPKLFRVKKVRPLAKETLHQWGLRALGAPITEKILSVATLGVYGCDAKDLSASLLLGRFFDPTRLRNRPGIKKGTVSVVGGIEQLLIALRKRLDDRGVKFQTGIDARAYFLGNHREDSTVILATPAWKAWELLEAINPTDERIPALRRILAIPLISVTVFFKRTPPRRGFGTLFSQSPPLGESDGILGCLQNSEIFEGRASDGVHSETWILGGPHHGPRLIQAEDSEILEKIFDKRDRWIDSGSREALLESVITRWPQAIPHYSTELEQAIPLLKSDQNGILLFGNYLGDLGLSSILESTRLLRSRTMK